MPLVLANRVQETGTANTTVSFTLTGAVTGFQSFAVIGNTNTTYYSATDGSGNWEVGVGTYSTTGPTLARTTVYASSNSNLAVTFSGAVNVFVTYPSGRSVNLNESGNVSALGTVSSGVWQGSTVGVAYGGTGVTASSGPNSVVLRDANENITVNRLSQGLMTTTASGGTTILTAASDFNQQLIGTGGHTFRLPDATTLTDTTTFQFNNNATGTLTIQNNAATTVGTVAPGGAAGIALMSNATSGGTWDVHAYIPENVTWGTNALALGSTVITGGTWNGGTITSAYGGTGLTTFTGANNALYSTSASALAAGTLPVAAGGTGATTLTGYVYGNGTGAMTASTSIPNSATTATNANTASAIVARDASGNFSAGTITASLNGNASTATTAANVNNGTLTLAVSGTGLSGAASFTANQATNATFTVASNATSANTASTIVARDVSGNFSAGTITATLSGSATSAGSVSNSVTFNNGGAGGASGSTFNGSGALTVSYNTVGAPSTGGANASGTWGISISGNAATATSATSATTATTATNWGAYGAVPAAGTSFANANTIGRSDANGYAYFNYINSNTSNGENGTVSQVIITNGTDNFYRKATIAHLTSNLSGTAPINISGNAATATTATTASNVNNGTLTMNVSGVGLSGSQTFTANQAGAATFTVTSNATNANTASTIVSRDASGNFSAGTITATLNGNASTATTASNVNNGTLTMNVSGTGLSGSQTFTANQAGAATFTVTSNATSANTASTIVARDASGNFSAGTITGTSLVASSDERLKKNWRDLPADFLDQLAIVKHGTFDRVDQEITQDGVSAQSLKSVLPHSVALDADGMLSVAYGNAALVAAIELAKRVVEQEARINRLEALVAKLIGD